MKDRLLSCINLKGKKSCDNTSSSNKRTGFIFGEHGSLASVGYCAADSFTSVNGDYGNNVRTRGVFRPDVSTIYSLNGRGQTNPGWRFSALQEPVRWDCLVQYEIIKIGWSVDIVSVPYSTCPTWGLGLMKPWLVYCPHTLRKRLTNNERTNRSMYVASSFLWNTDL